MVRSQLNWACNLSIEESEERQNRNLTYSNPDLKQSKNVLYLDANKTTESYWRVSTECSVSQNQAKLHNIFNVQSWDMIRYSSISRSRNKRSPKTGVRA